MKSVKKPSLIGKTKKEAMTRGEEIAAAHAELDARGHPTAKTLQIISIWSCADAKALMDFMHSIWKDGTVTIKEGGEENVEYHFATGGWSGNEELIGALEKNKVFWKLFWLDHKQGGLYIFSIPKEL